MSPSVKKAYVEFRDKRKSVPKLPEVKLESQKTIITKRNGLVLRKVIK